MFITLTPVGVIQPLLEQGLELAHVLEREVEGLEPGYRCLTRSNFTNIFVKAKLSKNV